MNVIRDAFGHSSLATTDRYLRAVAPVHVDRHHEAARMGDVTPSRRELAKMRVVAPIVAGVMTVVLLAVYAAFRGIDAVVQVLIVVVAVQVVIQSIAFLTRRSRRRGR